MIVRIKAPIFSKFGYSGTTTTMISENTLCKVAYAMNMDKSIYLEPVGGGDSFVLPLEIFQTITEEVKEGV